MSPEQFLANVSHEIRTPMNGIQGWLGAHDAETQRCRAAQAATILNSGQTLLALLNDMLDFPKVEAGKIELTQAVFDPRQIVAETVAIFRELAQAKGLVIESDLHVPANRSYRADPIRLRQMLSNLISNAIKFTSRGSVRVEVTEVDGTENHALLEFAVTDSGIGIPPDKHVVLFKPFSQADSSTTRDYGGTGLGLSIVRNLALLMGGDAGLKPAGTGLAFLVPHSSRYPASRRRESPVPAPPRHWKAHRRGNWIGRVCSGGRGQPDQPQSDRNDAHEVECRGRQRRKRPGGSSRHHAGDAA